VAEGGKLFLFDLVVDGKGLQGRLVDGAQRLGLVRERARIKFSQIYQFRYFLSIRRGWGALARETQAERPRVNKNDPGGPYIPILTAFYDGFLRIGAQRRLCYSKTWRDFWWVRIFLFTRWSALSIVLVSQASSSAISS